MSVVGSDRYPVLVVVPPDLKFAHGICGEILLEGGDYRIRTSADYG